MWTAVSLYDKINRRKASTHPLSWSAFDKAPQTIDERIEALEAELAQLKETRDKELIGKLMYAIAESGKSVQDVIDMVKTEKTHATGAERTENS